MLWSISIPAKLKEGLIINWFICIQQASKPSGTLTQKSVSPIPNGKMCDIAPTAQYGWYVLFIWHLQAIYLGLFSSLYPFDLDDQLSSRWTSLYWVAEVMCCFSSTQVEASKKKKQTKRKKMFMLRLVKCFTLHSRSCHEICGHLRKSMSYIHVDSRKHLPCASQIIFTLNYLGF